MVCRRDRRIIIGEVDLSISVDPFVDLGSPPPARPGTSTGSMPKTTPSPLAITAFRKAAPLSLPAPLGHCLTHFILSPCGPDQERSFVPSLSEGADRGRFFAPLPAGRIFTHIFARAGRAKGDALAQGQSSPPPPGADRDRYVMRIALKHLPSPLMGEGVGGGGSRASPPHPHLPPPGGKGC